MRSFLVAVSFLTIIPVRFRKQPTLETVAESRLWFPVVGLLIGALMGGTTALAMRLESHVGVFLVLLIWVAITGALHLDGLADLCDGLFAGPGPEERLRIMKDPHVGAFGLVGVGLLLLGKFAALIDLMLLMAGNLSPAMVMLAVWVGRVLVFVLAADARYPRESGTGKALVEASRLRDPLMLGWLAAVAIFLMIGLGPVTGGLLLAVPLLAVVALRWICERRLGGVTGDCLGAGIEVAELTCLVTATFLVAG